MGLTRTLTLTLTLTLTSPKDGSAAAVLAPLREASGPAEVAPSPGLITTPILYPYPYP